MVDCTLKVKYRFIYLEKKIITTAQKSTPGRDNSLPLWISSPHWTRKKKKKKILRWAVPVTVLVSFRENIWLGFQANPTNRRKLEVGSSSRFVSAQLLLFCDLVKITVTKRNTNKEETRLNCNISYQHFFITKIWRISLCEFVKNWTCCFCDSQTLGSLRTTDHYIWHRLTSSCIASKKKKKKKVNNKGGRKEERRYETVDWMTLGSLKTGSSYNKKSKCSIHSQSKVILNLKWHTLSWKHSRSSKILKSDIYSKLKAFSEVQKYYHNLASHIHY